MLTLLGSKKFRVNISVPLVLEYEKAAKSIISKSGSTTGDIENILDYMCAVSERRKIFYLWRPFLLDPKDDMILELAVAANCDFIVTYNKKDFQRAKEFEVEVITPREFLKRIGELP